MKLNPILSILTVIGLKSVSLLMRSPKRQDNTLHCNFIVEVLSELTVQTLLLSAYNWLDVSWRPLSWWRINWSKGLAGHQGSVYDRSSEPSYIEHTFNDNSLIKRDPGFDAIASVRSCRIQRLRHK